MKRHVFPVFLVLAAWMISANAAHSLADDLPPANRIWDVSCIPDREKTRLEFPDLIRFRGDWYCSFREGEIHANHPSGRGRVIRSADGETWETVALFEWEGGDVRDPRLSITAEGWLMVNTSIYFVSKAPRPNGMFYQLDRASTPASDEEVQGVARQSVTWLSADGENWSSVYACPTGINTWRWNADWHDGMGYSIGYSGKDSQGALYRTRDGKTWNRMLGEFFPEGQGTEAALAFDPSGKAICLLRDGPSRAMLGVGEPPFYRDWQWKSTQADWQGADDPRLADEVLGTALGGPKILCLSDGRLLGAARIAGRVTLFWVDPENGLLTKLKEFEGTSYPGVVEHEGMIWVSYGVRDASAIYLDRVKP